MATKKTKNTKNSTSLSIPRSYDIYSIEKRVHDLESNGGGASITMTEIYSGNTDIDIVLSENYDTFDLILIVGRNSGNNVETQLLVSEYLATGDKIGLIDEATASWYIITNKKTFAKQSIAAGKFIRKVYGIKF